MKHSILFMAAMSLHQTQAFVSHKPFHHKIKVHSTTTNKNIFNVDVNRPSASFLLAKNGNYSTEVRLREEADNPFRKVRFFVYSVLLAGCTISLLVSAARIAAGLNGINADLLDESIQNAGIDLGGLALLSFLLKQDFDAQESKLKRASKGGQIASLQVRFASPDPLDEKFTTLNLSSFRAGRGIDKRVVIVAGGEEKIDQVIDQISDTSFQDALTLNDLVVIPLVTTNGVAPNMNEDLLRSNCIAIPTGRSWKEFIDEEISSAESQGVNVSKDGFALILKKNGRVGQRTKGINLSQMFSPSDLGPPLQKEMSGLLEGRCTTKNFDIGVTLGTGSFGRVRFATHRESGRPCAIKMLKKAAIIRFQQVEHIMSEKEILIEMSKDPHPFVVNLMTTFNDEKYIYMVLDYIIGGEFFTHLRNAGTFNSETASFYAAQVVLVFESLHCKDIIYRDLKPENLLLDRTGYLKITDFGFAKKIDFKTFTLCGTPEYIAPEVLLNKGHGKGVDWWTLGILIYEMLAGEPPFVDLEPMGIYQKILSEKLSFPKGYDKAAKSLTKKLLTHDLTRRFGCLKNGTRDIKRSKWYANSDFKWKQLERRELEAPIKIEVSDDSDTSLFEDYPDSDDEGDGDFIKHDPFFNF